MTRARAVLFGLGGTLVAEAADPGQALAERLGLDAEQARRLTALVLGTTFDDAAALAARLQAELGLGPECAAAVNAVWSAQRAEPAVIAGAATCVGAVHAAGVRVAVVADAWTPYADAARAACVPFATGIDRWFLSSEVGAMQANGALLAAALAALEVAASDALVVGDSLEHDVRPALALGAGAVWLRHDAGGGGVVAVDPHGASVPAGAPMLPESAVVARTLAEVRRLALTRLWATRGGRFDLTVPLPA
jgi:FMN phosphatase YigB (HAD superfamily)